MVDELVEFSAHDPELADGIKWLDGQAQKKGITFYDMVFEVLYSHDINSKAQNWLKQEISLFPIFYWNVSTSLRSFIFSNVCCLWSV